MAHALPTSIMAHAFVKIAHALATRTHVLATIAHTLAKRTHALSTMAHALDLSQYGPCYSYNGP